MNRYKYLKVKKYGNGYLVYSNFCKAICETIEEIYEVFLCYGKNENEIRKFVETLLSQCEII